MCTLPLCYGTASDTRAAPCPGTFQFTGRVAPLVRSTAKESFKDPNLKASLTPYHPNAMRSRLPVHFKGEAKPFRRFCQQRNQHTYE